MQILSQNIRYCMKQNPKWDKFNDRGTDTQTDRHNTINKIPQYNVK